MKWLHISDLHVGFTHEAADLEADQKAVLNEILDITRTEKPDGVLIAGDVYDRSIPPERAIRMLNDFLTALCALCPVYIISGNHDSGSRLSFVSSLLEKQNLYIAGSYQGELIPVTQGDTDIYLMPFLHPGEVRRVLNDYTIPANMDAATRAVLATRKKGSGKYSILLAHLFVTANGAQPETCESEQKYIGGIDSVDVSAFDDFDYVALGHIHGPQKVGRETVRYCGTPMMYSFSEQHHKKSVVLVEPGSAQPVRLIPLTAGRKMRVVRGMLSELTAPGNDPLDHNDIVLAELTDPQPRADAAARLADIYRTVVIKYVALQATVGAAYDPTAISVEDPVELFAHFFAERNNNTELTEEQRAEVARLMKTAEED